MHHRAGTYRVKARKPRQDLGGDIDPGPSALLGPPMSEVTRVLSAIEQGDRHAAEQLLPLVYDELRKLAAQRLAQEKPGQTLQPTALVHEAYLRLVGRGDEPHWDNWVGRAADRRRIGWCRPATPEPRDGSRSEACRSRLFRRPGRIVFRRPVGSSGRSLRR